MGISTNSVIHYTSSIQNIFGILAEGFRIKYCLETLVTNDEGKLNSAFTMVCFCDIPLSEIRNHVDSYGYYGIGLTKEWAKKKKLNPVLYIDSNSTIGPNLIRQLRRIANSRDDSDDSRDLIDEFAEIMCYTKNYEGEITKGVDLLKNYRFYDEREWRYIPSMQEIEPAWQLAVGKRYLANKAEFNDKVSHVRLTFEPKDIAYILIKSEEEITQCCDEIRKIFSNKCSVVELEMLLTRIMTMERVIKDF